MEHAHAHGHSHPSHSHEGHNHGSPQMLPYLLKTAALAIWSGVLLYFCFSGKLPFFLAPVFRPMVYAAGFTLAAIAALYGIFGRPSQRSAEFECEHHHEENSNIQVVAFLVLVLPVCLALFISKDGYSKLAVANRGFQISVPDSQSQLALWADHPVEATALASGAGEAKPEIYAPDAEFIQEVAPGEVAPAEDAVTGEYALETVEPPLPGQEVEPAPAPQTASEKVQKIRGFLSQMPKDDRGYTILETTDLIYAAQEPGFREAMAGLKVALVGQYYPAGDATNERLASGAGPGQVPASGPAANDYFWLVRMTMNCCAADARPSAVKIQPSANAGQGTKYADMEWLSMRGVAEFREPTQAKDGVAWEPWIVADEMGQTESPAEPYLF